MSTKTITVIEFDYHAVVLRNFCKMIEGIDLKVNVFTNKSIWEKVDLYKNYKPENIELYIKHNQQPVKDFIKEKKSILDNSDYIIFNTIASNFKLFSSLNYNSKIILRVHNANTFFNNPLKAYCPKINPKYIFKDIYYTIFNIIIKREIYYRNNFLNKVNYFSFPNESIRKYAIHKYNIPTSKAIRIPFSFRSEKENIREEKQKTTITIIGKVDYRNRNYNIVLEAFKKILKYDHQPIKLIFLGRTQSKYGKRIADRFSQLQSSKFEFLYFNEFVRLDDFKHYIEETDFLLLPIKKTTRYNIFCEKYGLTKISGAIDDVISYKKPGLIISGYPLEKDLNKILETFNNETDLANKITNWITSEKYKKLDIEESLENYTLDHLQKSFLSIINNLK
mgnify:CR=1 FL=1